MAKAPLNIRSLARAHTQTALKVLASIMTDKESPQPARVAAATALLDRGWGKPKQDVGLDVSDSLKELLEAIDGRTRNVLPGTMANGLDDSDAGTRH